MSIKCAASNQKKTFLIDIVSISKKVYNKFVLKASSLVPKKLWYCVAQGIENEIE